MIFQYTDLIREETEYTQSKEDILYQIATWNDIPSSTLQTDGSFTDGIAIAYLINVVITPTSGSKTKHIPLGLEEKSTHVMLTLKAWGIAEDDTIVLDSKTYRVTYKFPDQYSIDFQEYLLEVFN